MSGCGGWVNIPLSANYTSPGSNIQQCIEWCRGLMASYAAASGDDCFCSQSLDVFDMSMADSLCNLPCPGDDKQICGGGGGVMSVFNIGKIRYMTYSSSSSSL